MSEYVVTSDDIRNTVLNVWCMAMTEEEALESFERWLAEERAKAWDLAWREIQIIPRWWNPEDGYGEFDLQPLGPNETSEQGAYMAVREVMLDNPYRTEQTNEN